MTAVVAHHLPVTLMVTAFVKKHGPLIKNQLMEVKLALAIFQKHILVSGLGADFGWEVLCPFPFSYILEHKTQGGDKKACKRKSDSAYSCDIQLKGMVYCVGFQSKYFNLVLKEQKDVLVCQIFLWRLIYWNKNYFCLQRCCQVLVK